MKNIRKRMLAIIVSIGMVAGLLFGHPLSHVQASTSTITDFDGIVESINDIRQKVGITQLELDPHLSQSALNHAKYLRLNGHASRTGLETRYFESESEKGFTGRTSKERAVAAGFELEDYVMEIILRSSDLQAVVDRIINTTDGRVKLLEPTARKIGIGVYENVVVMDISYHEEVGKHHPPIMYPYDGQENVKVEHKREFDPFPEYDVYRTGYLITVRPDVQPGDTYIDEVRATIVDSKGRSVPFVYEENLAFDTFYLFPLTRLDYEETYTVSFDYNDRIFTWSFKTEAEPTRFDNLPNPSQATSLSTYRQERIYSSGGINTRPVLSEYVFSEGLALSIKQGRYGFIDESAQEVIPHIYRNGQNFSEGLAAVYDGEMQKWGYINKQGEVVIPFMYEEVTPFSEGLGAVKDESGKWGFVNAQGETIIPHIYDDVQVFTYGTAIVLKNGRVGVIDTSGKVVVPFDYSPIQNFFKYPLYYEYISLPDDSYNYELFSKLRKQVLKYPGLEVIPFSDRELLLAERNGKWGVIDFDGNIKVPFEYDYISSHFSEGLVIAGKYDSTGTLKLGYITENGEIKIPLIYDEALDLTEGIAVVGKTHSHSHRYYSLLDREGKVIKDGLLLSYVSPMSNGKALVSYQENDKYGNRIELYYGLIDKQGNIITPIEYTSYHLYYDRDGKKLWEFDEKLQPEQQVVDEFPSIDLSYGEPYVDFQPNQYWSQAMLWAIKEGLITGYEEKNSKTGKIEKLLKPSAPLSEAQFLTILFRYNEPMAMTFTAPIDPDWWADVPYQIAESYGLPVKGSLSNRNKANAPITRGEMATILGSYYTIKYLGGENLTAREAVQLMYDMGISNGYPDKDGNIPKTYESFGVNNILLREHVVTFMRNYVHYLENRL